MNHCKVIKTYTTCDITILYTLDDAEVPSLSIIPTQMEERIAKRRLFINDDQGMKPLHEVFKRDFSAVNQTSLVQVKITGDINPGGFSGGCTMTNSDTTHRLKFSKQWQESFDEGFHIITELLDDRGLRALHKLTTWKDLPFIEISTQLQNDSKQDLTLELLASFSLGGLSPFQSDQGTEKYCVHRFSSTWSAEGRHICQPIEQLGLEKSWSGHGVRSLRFGQVGSQPVKGWFPFVGFEDLEHKVLWGAQIAHPGSWQLEVFRQSDLFNISGGLADRETGHWMKVLQPNQSFETPKSVLSCCRGDIQDLCDRMLKYQCHNDINVPNSEKNLPVIFNDWCTTWGHPSEKNILSLANSIEGFGIDYLVMDDGWFNDKPGIQQGLGDWNISKTIYPNGFKNLHHQLKEKGFVSGVWFELECCTKGSKIFEQTEHLLHRDGHVLEVSGRRFLDFRDPWVHEYLDKKVIQMLKENNINYLKTDYNDTIGLGCDGAESLGEGLREHLSHVQAFYRRMKKEIPGLVIEICASGGHRLEPSWMSLGSMGGFSDSHEGFDIPIIGANTQRMIPAHKNQVWAVLRKEDSLERLIYSLSATFMGRMCLSGDIDKLNPEQLSVVKSGIQMYHKIKASIKCGNSRRYGTEHLSYTSPKGWQAVVRTHESKKEAFVVIHTFSGAPTKIEVPLSQKWNIADCYKNENVNVDLTDDKLCISGHHDFNGLVVQLK
jgi:alpha-galactosidase